MDWQDFASALCLVFVIEGLLPFIKPAAWKESMARIIELDDRSLRSFALVSMLLGVAGLMLVRA